MMHDAAGLSHSRWRNDDHGSHRLVERLRLRRLTCVSRLLKAKKLLHTLHEVLGAIEDLRMHLEDARHLDGEGTVDVDRDCGDFSGERERVEIVYDLLGTTHRECRNENAPATGRCGGDDPRQLLTRRLVRCMVPIAVCGFHDHEISPLWNLRVANDRKPSPSDIAREDQPPSASVFFEIE